MTLVTNDDGRNFALGTVPQWGDGNPGKIQGQGPDQTTRRASGGSSGREGMTSGRQPGRNGTRLVPGSMAGGERTSRSAAVSTMRTMGAGVVGTRRRREPPSCTAPCRCWSPGRASREWDQGLGPERRFVARPVGPAAARRAPAPRGALAMEMVVLERGFATGSRSQRRPTDRHSSAQCRDRQQNHDQARVAGAR